MNLSFKIYTYQNRLIAVIFPSEGGSAHVRKTWKLDSIGLEKTGKSKPDIEMSYGNFKVKREKALQKGGLELHIDYNNGTITVIPKTEQNTKIYSKQVVYSFDDLMIKDNRMTDIQKAKNKVKLTIRQDKKPLSDEKYKSIE